MKITKRDRILKRFNKAIDKAIQAGVPTGRDAWCLLWSRAYRNEISKESKQ